MLLLTALGGCSLTKTLGTSTETFCTRLGEFLPSRRHADTPDTQNEIGRLYNFYREACRRDLPFQ